MAVYKCLVTMALILEVAVALGSSEGGEIRQLYKCCPDSQIIDLDSESYNCIDRTSEHEKLFSQFFNANGSEPLQLVPLGLYDEVEGDLVPNELFQEENMTVGFPNCDVRNLLKFSLMEDVNELHIIT